ncbi:hypothetical protein C8F01DRAFT_1148148 [Mycena amicta]|nr:hypothetical protein C8F01DRAFT_1148148 [Mycena amicta]
MSESWTISDHVDVLKKSLETATPYTCGVHTVRKEDLGLFFRSAHSVAENDSEARKSAQYIDFASLAANDLEQLAAACEKATFGADHGDVLDETYRKAGKLDVDRFAVRLDVSAAGIIDAITPELLLDQNDSAKDARVIRAEMYKLNVYGPGSFFKAHKDTPRANNMIGSLVVVLPTEHEGGALTLSHGEGRWVFDSAGRLKTHQSTTSNSLPAVAYIAFFSDVTHTVEPVTSGYRVTLTYNLFLTARSAGSASSNPNTRMAPPPELACETSLRALLSNPKWFPTGGYLAFGLAHQYPVPRNPDTKKTLPVLDLTFLKGCDARLRNAALRAGLEPRVRLVYKINEGTRHLARVVMDAPVEIEWEIDAQHDETGPDEQIEEQGKVLEEVGVEGVSARKNAKAETVHWVTPATGRNKAETSFTGYFGNAYDKDCVYGYAQLFVRIPAVGKDGRTVSDVE